MATITLSESKQETFSLPLPIDPTQPPQVDYLRVMHELSGCNTPALRAVLLCVEAGIPFPEWLRNFLAVGIKKHLKDRQSSLDRSLGLSRQEGPHSDDVAYDLWWKRFLLVNRVHVLKDKQNPKTKRAYGITGACEYIIGPSVGYGMNAESLRRLYRRYRQKLCQ